MKLFKIVSTVKSIQALVIFALFFSGCVKEVMDTIDNPAEIELKGAEWALPLANLELKFGDIIEEKGDTVKYEEDGVIMIRYRHDSVFSIVQKKFIDLPALLTGTSNYCFVLNATKNNVQKDTVKLNFGKEDEIKLEIINISSCEIAYSITANFPFKAKLILELPVVSGRIDTIHLERASNPNQQHTTSGTLIMENEVMLLQGNNGLDNSVCLAYHIIADAGDFLSLAKEYCINTEFTINNLKFNHIEGQLKPRSIEIEPGKIEIGKSIDLFDKVSGKLSLQDPKLKLNFINSGIGADFDLNLNLTATSCDNRKISLIDPVRKDDTIRLALNGPQNPTDGTVYDTLIINNKNKLNEFISLPPSTIEYGGKIIINANERTENNFITNAEAFDMGIEIEFPLKMQLENITWEGELAEISPEFHDYLDVVSNTSIFVRAENQFPVDFYLSFVVYNRDTIPLDTIQFEDKIIGSPEIDLLTNKTIGTWIGDEPVELSLSSGDIDMLKLGSFMKIVPTIATCFQEGEYVDVVFCPDYTLKIEIAVCSEINLDNFSEINP